MSPRINRQKVDETLLLRLFATLSETVVLVDPDRSILFVNRHDRLGFTRDEVIGTDLLDYVSPESRERHAEQIRTVIRTGEPDSDVVELVDAEGRRRWFRATATPMPEGGEVTAVAVVTEEITEVRCAREEIAMLKQLLPVCAWCGRLRDEENHWHSLESFVARSGARVTHSVCPDCASRIE